jgi:hypothetical protein
MYLHASTLFKIAKDACERCNKEFGPREHAGGDPVVSIVFSVAAAEAFMNEIIELVPSAIENTKLLGMLAEHPGVAKFEALCTATEEARGSVKLKFMMGRLAFTGEVYDKGTRPYQDFDLLIKVRNWLLHMRPLDVFDWDPAKLLPGLMPLTVEVPPFVKGLRSKNLLVDKAQNALPNSFYDLSTPAMASWACETVVAMVQSFIEVVPDTGQIGCYRYTLNLFFGNNFTVEK